jgi:maltooligosyltrehalose trehalohydrolase
VVFSQNHDQVGNRFLGERVAHLADFESAKLAAAAVILSPYIPMLFMGEEYADPAPFLYFVSHADEKLIEAVRTGRREEFNHFHFTGEVPDPQSEESFLRSKLNHELWHQAGKHQVMRHYYCELLALRRTEPLLTRLSRRGMNIEIDHDGRLIAMMRRDDDGASLLVLLAFGDRPAALPAVCREEGWNKLLDSSDLRWNGPGAAVPGHVNPRSCVILANEVHHPLSSTSTR